MRIADLIPRAAYFRRTRLSTAAPTGRINLSGGGGGALVSPAARIPKRTHPDDRPREIKRAGLQRARKYQTTCIKMPLNYPQEVGIRSYLGAFSVSNARPRNQLFCLLRKEEERRKKFYKCIYLICGKRLCPTIRIKNWPSLRARNELFRQVLST